LPCCDGTVIIVCMHSNGDQPKPGRRSGGRDLERTRRRLVAAAFKEFVARGFAGARTKAIARRAGVHEWMVFYCFGSKQNLYREVLREQLAKRTRLIGELPEDFPAAVMTAFKMFARDRDVLRLFQWEALTTGKGKLLAGEERRAAFRQGGAWLESLQQRGVLPAGIDLTLFRMAMVALASFPFAFPQIIELATGFESTDTHFQDRWAALLCWFVERVLAEPSQSVFAARAAKHVARASAK
jgi:TetR/AcrR family transcriptional regulator